MVLESGTGSIVGIEVKASATVGDDDFAGLRHLRQKVGIQFAAGVVPYSGSSALPFADGLWALPLSALWNVEQRRA